MDIKDLNKPQLILLAVLLSFIVSIATGITTVTLMQQAPVSFTTPMNRVVQQTIEKIQQVEGKTVTQTVVVKEEDLVVDALAKNKSAMFTVTREVQDADFHTIEISAGKGFVVTKEGILVADSALVPEKGTYYVKNEGGKFKADFLVADKAGFSLLKIGAPVDDKSKLSFSVPSFGDINKMKTGQQILILGNTISSFMFMGLNSDKSLDLSITKSNAGSMVLNLDGEALGVGLSSDATPFVPIKSVVDAVTAFSTPMKAEAGSAVTQ